MRVTINEVITLTNDPTEKRCDTCDLALANSKYAGISVYVLYFFSLYKNPRKRVCIDCATKSRKKANSKFGVSTSQVNKFIEVAAITPKTVMPLM